MHKVLVTGASGQLGSEIRVRQSYNTNFLFTDVAELDITDIYEIRKHVSENDIDVIVNCAAYTNVDKAEDDEKTCDLINHIAVANLAKICLELDCTLIHVSTDYVFDGPNFVPYRENDSTSPLGVYGRTKLAGEKSIVSSGCDYIIIRTSWLYSSFGHNFVKTMLKLTSEKPELKVVFDQVGTPTFAGDLAEMILMIIETPLMHNKNNLYHFSNEGICSWYDFAMQIRNLSNNKKCRILPCHSNELPSKVKRPNYSVLDKSKIKEAFGIEIPYWKDSLDRCINKLI